MKENKHIHQELIFPCQLLPKKVTTSSNSTMIWQRFYSSATFLTIFAVDFDSVGGELKGCSTFACLWEPEVLHLTVSA